MNFKFHSTQIIIFLIAFLIGIGVTSMLNSNQQSTDVMEATEEVSEAVTEDATSAPEDEVSQPAVTTTTATKASSVGTNLPKTVTGKCYTSLSGYKDSKLNAIILNWSACQSDDFQFYKLVKSSKNSNPSYPADGVAFSSSNKNAANFVDKTVAARTTYYYRMCVVQRLNQVNCSNVVSVSY
ncbi:hypothetical protein JXD20_01285 [Candidatus Peregrinibacteria bacterium]|nr:hypothetical protein [Candidatus Peregrinibacteria bacterium]